MVIKLLRILKFHKYKTNFTNSDQFVLFVEIRACILLRLANNANDSILFISFGYFSLTFIEAKVCKNLVANRFDNTFTRVKISILSQRKQQLVMERY